MKRTKYDERARQTEGWDVDTGGKRNLGDSRNIGKRETERRCGVKMTTARKKTRTVGMREVWMKRDRGGGGRPLADDRAEGSHQSFGLENRLALPPSPAPPQWFRSKGPTGAAARLCHLSACRQAVSFPPDVSRLLLQVSPSFNRPEHHRSNPSDRRSSSNALPLAPFPRML